MICYDFSVQNDLSFNSSKSLCMLFKPKSHKLSCPILYMDNLELKYADNFKYLGLLLVLIKRMTKIYFFIGRFIKENKSTKTF